MRQMIAWVMIAAVMGTSVAYGEEPKKGVGAGQGGAGQGSAGGGGAPKAKPDAPATTAPAAPQVNILRMPFSDLFLLEQGRVSVKRPVRLSSGLMGPGGSIACGSTRIQDVDLCTLAGRDLAVEMDGQTPVIKGYFKE